MAAYDPEFFPTPQTQTEKLRTRITELERQRDELRAALVQAREDMREWAGYVDAYYLDKWNFAGDLAAIDAALEASK
jgi:hypothetical protein